MVKLCSFSGVLCVTVMRSHAMWVSRGQGQDTAGREALPEHHAETAGEGAGTHGVSVFEPVGDHFSQLQ